MFYYNIPTDILYHFNTWRRDWVAKPARSIIGGGTSDGSDQQRIALFTRGAAW
jgi:hypothetical protein